MKKIVVLSGSIRIGRKSHLVAKIIHDQLKGNESYESVLLDLKLFHFPMMEERLDNASQFPEGFKEFSDTLAASDGIIIVSPEYKNGIPGALKNVLDMLSPQLLKHKPIGIVTVSSGGFGGVNCLSQLRLVTLALGGTPIPEKLCISSVNTILNADEELVDATFPEKVAGFIQAFSWYVQRFSA